MSTKKGFGSTFKGLFFEEVGEEVENVIENKSVQNTTIPTVKIDSNKYLGKDESTLNEEILKGLSEITHYDEFKKAEQGLISSIQDKQQRYNVALIALGAVGVTGQGLKSGLENYASEKKSEKESLIYDVKSKHEQFVSEKNEEINNRRDQIVDIETKIEELKQKKSEILNDISNFETDIEESNKKVIEETNTVSTAYDKALIVINGEISALGAEIKETV